VTPDDVEHIVAIMGRPEDYGAGHAGEPKESKKSEPKSEHSSNKTRRIFRDAEDAVVGGVCSGLSHYLGWDPLVLRIIAVLIGFVSFGSAFIGYAILWALIPEAKTTPEKLQMRGEPVNVENISRFVNEEAARASQNVNRMAKKFSASSNQVAKGAGMVITKIIGAMLSFMGIGLLIALMVVLTAADSHIFGWSGGSFGFFNTYIWDDPSMSIWLMTAIILLMGAPAMGLLYSGIRLLIGTVKRIPFLGTALIGLFIVGAIIAFWSGTQVASQFSRHAEFKTDLILPTQEVGDTLYISTIEDQIFKGRNEDHRSLSDLVKRINDSTYYGDPIHLSFETTTDDQFRLRVIRQSEGMDLDQAGELANNIRYVYAIEGNSLRLSTVFSTPGQNQYRAQAVNMTLYVPQGKFVYIDKNISWITWYDEDEENKAYVMCYDRLEESCPQLNSRGKRKRMVDSDTLIIE
jgi:phage shock protein PspC (stress-responsive transcriptional regulator)